MALQRRTVLCSLGATLASGVAGCLSRWEEGEAELQATSNKGEHDLDITITDDEDEQSFAETLTVTEDEWIERESVVTGRNEDPFTISVTKDDETVSRTWPLNCVGDDDRVDVFEVIITGRESVS